MKRIKVYREGKPTAEADPRTIKPGGVTFPEEPIPVYANTPLTKGGSQIIGSLDRIRRDRDGWVTAEPKGFRLKKGYALSAHIYAPPGKSLVRDDVMGTLRAAHVTDTPVWPGMEER